MIQIRVESHFNRYYNYNMIAMCGGFDNLGTQLYVTSRQKGEGESTTILEADDAATIEAIIYFIPISLPGGKGERIENYKPFEATIEVSRGGNTIYNAAHQINAWGGAAIKLNL